MKKLIYALFPFLLGIMGNHAFAQENNESNKETQEIIIRKQGDKNATLKIEFNGDKLIVNGKPLTEFEGTDGITINKRKMIVGNGFKGFDMDGFMNGFNLGDNQQAFGNGQKNFKLTSGQPFLGISMDKADNGVKITDVTKESAAEKAGLQKDDIVTAIDDTKTTSDQVLSEYIRSKKVGDKIKIYYLRNGKKEKTNAVLQENKNMRFNYGSPNGRGNQGNPRVFTFPPMPDLSQIPGMNYNGMSGGPKLGITITEKESGNGVTVSDIEDDSPADKAGIKKDDIITAINGKKVDNTDDARNALKMNRDDTSYPVTLLRNGKEQVITVSFPKKLKTINL